MEWESGLFPEFFLLVLQLIAPNHTEAPTHRVGHDLVQKQHVKGVEIGIFVALQVGKCILKGILYLSLPTPWGRCCLTTAGVKRAVRGRS